MLHSIFSGNEPQPLLIKQVVGSHRPADRQLYIKTKTDMSWACKMFFTSLNLKLGPNQVRLDKKTSEKSEMFSLWNLIGPYSSSTTLKSAWNRGYDSLFFPCVTVSGCHIALRNSLSLIRAPPELCASIYGECVSISSQYICLLCSI